VLHVVVLGLRALHLGAQWHARPGEGRHGLHPPNAFTGGASVLLQHALAQRKHLRENLLELGYAVVRLSVWKRVLGPLQLRQGVLSAILEHSIGMRERHHAVLDEVAQHVKVWSLVGQVPRIDAMHVAVRRGQDVLVNGVLLGVRVKYNLRLPSTRPHGIHNGQGVLAETIRSLVGSPSHLKDHGFLLQQVPCGRNGGILCRCLHRR